MRSTYVVRARSCVRMGDREESTHKRCGRPHLLALVRATAARRQTIHVPSDSVGFARATKDTEESRLRCLCHPVDLGVCGSLGATTTDEVAGAASGHEDSFTRAIHNTPMYPLAICRRFANPRPP